jgi:predicted nucleotide-binding protein
MSPKQLLNEVEEILRTVPPVATRRHPEPENKQWLGRSANAIQQWDASRIPEFNELLKRFHAPMAREAGEAFQQILVLLNQAQYDLHAKTRAAALEEYRRKLKAQDDLIRSASGREIPIGVSLTLINLFNEIRQTFPELNLRPFEGHGNGEVLRSQISLATETLSSNLGVSVTSAEPQSHQAPIGSPANPELVFVIHGRQLLEEFHIFVRALGLKPLEWSEARRRTAKPNPYTWEIVDLALRQAGAIVALLTPDDEARLQEHLWTTHENALEKQYLPQPRQNVLFEAGVAYGRNPNRTVLIRIGPHRPMSDLAGHHILSLDDSPESRQAVVDALRLAGCPVDVSGTDWYRSGKFSVADSLASTRHEADLLTKDSARLQLFKAQINGFSEIRDAANIVSSIHSFFSAAPQYLNDANIRFLEKYPLNFREKLSFDTAASNEKWSIEELKHDVQSLQIK